ncbi:MAG: sulfite exporter TauE/SafE family protein [Planctomycetota bacterium]
MQSVLDSLIFGAANSLHCAGMCGPLAACSTGGGAAAMYHTARVASYATAGAVAGGIGASLGATAVAVPSAWIALLLATTMLALAIGGTGRLANVPGLTSLYRHAGRWSARRSPSTRAAALGLITPLLPCGLVWAVLASAGVAGSPAAGAGVGLGFAAGSLPLLAITQLHVGVIRRWLSPGGRARLQRWALLAAAMLLTWRAWQSWQDASCCGA